jgi:hypothetical protein
MNWVSTGNTESGDDLALIFWGPKKPLNSNVEAFYREAYHQEYEEVGFVHWELVECMTPNEYISRYGSKPN